MKEFVGIQYLRGLAAFLVVVYHLGQPLERMGHTGGWPRGLAAGVDIFFVISGFVMWMSTRNRPTSITGFWWKRFARIAPLYWLVTTFMVVILLVAPAVIQTSVFDLRHIIASYLFVAYPNPGKPVMEPLVFPGWTLNYEMFFYLIFGLMLPLKPAVRLVAICLTLVLIVVAGALIAPPELTLAKFYTADILLEFVFGLLVGEMAFRKTRWPAGSFPAFAALALLGFAGLFLLQDLSWLPRAFRYGLPAMALVGGVVGMEQSRGIREVSLLHLLGNASYSLYLSQLIVMAAVWQIWKRLHLSALPGKFVLFSIVDVSAALAGGIVCYWFIERPIIAMLRPRKPRKVEAQIA